MDYDFITTCNWTSTGTYTMQAFRGGFSNIVTSVSLFYRKKGDASWTETTNGEVVIASTGEWEIANDWNKSGNDCLFHNYQNKTDIDKCTAVTFNSPGTNVGNNFLLRIWKNCTNLKSMPEFVIPSGITTVGDYFLYEAWQGCTSLTTMGTNFQVGTGITTAGDYFLGYAWRYDNLTFMPVGFDIPSGLTTVGDDFFFYTWNGCTKLASMPVGFDIPSGLTTVGDDFFTNAWTDCTALKNDGDLTEPITFEFTTGATPFGGTCPITSDSPIVGTKETPVEIEVNRYVPSGAFFQLF